MSGKYDNCGCRLTIMAGAGGTEAQDWAQMLQRMYLRFFQRRGFKYKMVEEEVRCINTLAIYIFIYICPNVPSPFFIRLAEHLTAVRAWCKANVCLVGENSTCSSWRCIQG